MKKIPLFIVIGVLLNSPLRGISIDPYARYYYVKDHLGSIRVTVDEDNEVVSAQDYSAFGAIIRSVDNSDPNGKYKFTEKERDRETNYD